jgi:hypothetical protein
MLWTSCDELGPYINIFSRKKGLSKVITDMRLSQQIDAFSKRLSDHVQKGHLIMYKKHI